MKHVFAVTIDTDKSTFNEMMIEAREQIKRQLVELYMIKNQGSVFLTGKDLKTHHGNLNRICVELNIPRGRGNYVKSLEQRMAEETLGNK